MKHIEWKVKLRITWMKVLKALTVVNLIPWKSNKYLYSRVNFCCSKAFQFGLVGSLEDIVNFFFLTKFQGKEMFILCGINIWMKWKYMCSINCCILKSKVLFILEKKIAAMRIKKKCPLLMYVSSFINKTEVLIWQMMWLYFLRFSSLNSASCLNTFSSYFF